MMMMMMTAMRQRWWWRCWRQRRQRRWWWWRWWWWWWLWRTCAEHPLALRWWGWHGQNLFGHLCQDWEHCLMSFPPVQNLRFFPCQGQSFILDHFLSDWTDVIRPELLVPAGWSWSPFCRHFFPQLWGWRQLNLFLLLLRLLPNTTEDALIPKLHLVPLLLNQIFRRFHFVLFLQMDAFKVRCKVVGHAWQWFGGAFLRKSLFNLPPQLSSKPNSAIARVGNKLIQQAVHGVEPLQHPVHCRLLFTLESFDSVFHRLQKSHSSVDKFPFPRCNIVPLPVFFCACQSDKWLLQVLNWGQVFQSAAPSSVWGVGNFSEGNVLFFCLSFQLLGSNCAFVCELCQFFGFLQNRFHSRGVVESVFDTKFNCVNVTEVLGEVSRHLYAKLDIRRIVVYKKKREKMKKLQKSDWPPNILWQKKSFGWLWALLGVWWLVNIPTHWSWPESDISTV